jgi:very-short-patch-repair endonuclease
MNSELPFEPFDDKGRVVCQICGKSYQVISPPHLKTHKLKYSDYTKRYPDAPLASDEFTAKSKYGKNSDLFVNDKDISEFEIEDEIFVDEDPELEDLEFEKELKKVVDEVRDPVQNQKMRVLDHLRLHFANVEKDYKIRHISPISKKQLFEFITDFTDPVLKLVFDFPNTFWHNNDINIDPLKHDKLREQGWKVLVIKGRAPSPKDIDSVIDEMYI